MIRLEKGQHINLEKEGGSKLTSFRVGCNWGAITVEKSGFLGFGKRKEELDVDVDLSCVMTDESGQLVDTLYSPLYRKEMFTEVGLPDRKSTRLNSSH